MEKKTIRIKPTCFIVVQLLIIFNSCAQTQPIRVPDEIITKYADNSICGDASYLTIPLPDDYFLIIDNSVLFSRVYYQRYDTEYDYRSFLEKCFLHPEFIQHDSLVSTWSKHKLKSNHRLIMEAQTDIEAFSTKYLKNHFVKTEYKELEPQLCQAWFIAGGFIGYDCYGGRYSFDTMPLFFPLLEAATE